MFYAENEKAGNSPEGLFPCSRLQRFACLEVYVKIFR